jgi:hypothetical protein
MRDSIGETGANDVSVTTASRVDPGLEVQLRTLITQEVHQQLERERALIQKVGGVALKVIGGAFAALVAFLTALGFTTWKEIKGSATEYMQRRVDDLVQRTDGETGVKDTLNNLVNRAILSSALTSLQITSSKDGRAASDIAPNEWLRLKTWVKSENLGTQEFSDVLSMLNLQSDETKKIDANAFLSEMLSPPASSP